VIWSARLHSTSDLLLRRQMVTSQKTFSFRARRFGATGQFWGKERRRAPYPNEGIPYRSRASSEPILPITTLERVRRNPLRAVLFVCSPAPYAMFQKLLCVLLGHQLCWKWDSDGVVTVTCNRCKDFAFRPSPHSENSTRIQLNGLSRCRVRCPRDTSSASSR
jgi:hypothetical protein